jgi:hypothetical protein
MDFLQNSTICQWVGIFLIFYAVAALFIFLGLVGEKVGAFEYQSTPKDIVNYFLVGGAVASGITLAMGIIGIVGNNPETRNVLSLGDLGFAIIAMIIITALISFLAPLLVLLVTFLLKALFATVTYLATTIVIKPLQAWGDFLTRKTSNGEEGE